MLHWLKRILLSLVVLVVCALFGAWWLLHGSLPELDGQVELTGLSAPVDIQRDALGVVTIDAANEIDAMRALGYVHAQERYFEMDLMRRSAAGELSELFGPIAVEVDKKHRVHRMRARVTENFAAIAGDKLPQLQAYGEGINAGLAGLDVRPWPYLLLRQTPRRWSLADSALTGYAMYFDLQDADDERELALWKIQQHVPPALFALIARDGSSWDAPLQGAARGEASLPSPDVVDLRRLPTPARPRAFVTQDKPFVGSNNFAVAGTHTRDGRAIVADDMHLGLRAPNIWFRARLRYPDARAVGGKVDVQGFTLPGLPAVVVGSNGRVAWGFTNSYADTTDWKRIRPCGSERTEATPCTRLRTQRETIRVAGGPDVGLDVEDIDWGPILHHEADGTALALRWTAQLPASLNFGISNLAVAKDGADAARIADTSALPTQNFVTADREGRIAWRLIGPLPIRDGDCPASANVVDAITAVADAPVTGASIPATARTGTGTGSCEAWSIRTDRPPLLGSGEPGRLWTANNRTLDGDGLRQAGNGGYDLGARAQQIRDGLFAKDSFGERDLLAIQLDDRALFLQRWWELLRETSARSGNASTSPALASLAGASNTWQGRASTDSVSYRITRAWRLAVVARIADGLTAPAQAALGDDFFMPALAQLEGVVWPLVTQRPAHLLPRRYTSWDALFEDAAREVRDGLVAKGPLAERNWGERNTAHICHPLAKAIPLLGERFLCMPPDALSGDSNMPRVAMPSFGASERMVVSPGHEADGIIHMPGGQSGHPLSPFWGAGHDDWVHGRPTPFLPGATTHAMRMTPVAATR